MSKREGMEIDQELFPLAPAEDLSGSEVREPVSLPSLEQPFVTGFVDAPAGKVPQVSFVLTRQDRWGTFKARWGVGRMNYTVEPGLYALGRPDKSSRVFVTANYKMSFDSLRQSLPNLDGWILVLDTKGINVWCAAGKGTFGTEELVRRIRMYGLDQVVEHREVILPQLGAPGVAAHSVKKIAGFRVIYGPIRSTDLPAFLKAGMKATREMRRKTFTLGERAVLIPIELVAALKILIFILPIFFFLGGWLGGAGGYWNNAGSHGLLAVLAILSAVVMGTILTPLLLPFLPGRAFALKGFSISLAGVLLLLFLFKGTNSVPIGWIERLAWLLLVPALTAYLAMNFTGSSTYTSLSGVRKEMRWAVPLEIAGGVAGLILWLGTRFIQ